jgi:hypothetical protein
MRMVAGLTRKYNSPNGLEIICNYSGNQRKASS